MRAALGLALAFGGGMLALYVLSGRVPLAAATSSASGGTAQASQAGQSEPLNKAAPSPTTLGATLGGLFGGAGGLP